jgi:hypothetical protein
MNTLKYNDILDTYKRIDLYRAKYRHSDFTPYAWCFHGNKAQKWTGTCSNGRLTFTDRTQLADEIGIDTATYKYISFRFVKPSDPILPITSTGTITTLLAKQGSTVHSYKLTVEYTSSVSGAGTKEVIVPANNRPQTVFVDMSAEPGWTGTITKIGFSIVSNSNKLPTTFAAMSYSPVYCEYIKIDKDNVFANIADDPTITALDLNQMRGDVDTLAKQTVDWRGADRVRQFINTINKKDIDEVNQKISALLPYNGCATCDNFQCSCDGTDYGHIACQACNTCNQYSACATCDVTCHEEARVCSCDMSCYTEARECTCDNKCFGYQACACDGSCNTCYTGNVTCSTCDQTSYGIYDTCRCNGVCYLQTCLYQHTDTIANCSFCYVGCDTTTEYEGCRTYTGSGCTCNSSCNSQGGCPANEQYCGPACYVERCSCNGSDWVTACSCNSACFSQTSSCWCYTGYGEINCSTCDFVCNTESRECACNQTCYTEARECTCDQKCNSYQACATCDGCDLYRQCSCDKTCFQESCSQCHKTEYSAVPI